MVGIPDGSLTDNKAIHRIEKMATLRINIATIYRQEGLEILRLGPWRYQT